MSIYYLTMKVNVIYIGFGIFLFYIFHTSLESNYQSEYFYFVLFYRSKY
jgi:hypothetical protein